MKILIISANTLPASPAGPAYMLELIGSLSSREGYTVQVNKAYANHEHQAN